MAWPAITQAQGSLAFSALPGRLIHDATYLPRPSYWPPDWPWDGTNMNTGPSYRYGPALVRYNDNNLHFWACSEGDEDVADYIRYKNSTDGGVTWSTEVIAMAPTIGSDDGWAICDPNVIKVGSYYYLAYTATASSLGAGLNNHVFIARSFSPDKNFKKWNGSGWGGNPKPIIRYTGPVNKWGLGEPNMVVKGSTLFLYYTEDDGIAKTRVATTTLNSANWPANLKDRGYAISSRDFGEDQTDVKYLPEVNRFIATAIGRRFTSNSYVHVWQSTDGLRFQPISNDNIATNIRPTAHNIGMSGNFLGHAQMGTNEYIAYAYTGPGGEFGRWNSWLNKVRITGAGWTGPIPRKPIIMPIMMLLL